MNAMPITIDNNCDSGAKIKVIGVGGGGGNAINNMIKKQLTGVEFIAANTDKQALEHNLASVKIQIGKELTKGLGAGADPEKGKASIQESEKDVKNALAGADMIFVTCGMGGGTGTGAAPTIAKIAHELGALVVAIVTKPFAFESKRRVNLAETWIKELRENVDALIVIPNQRLLEIIDKNTTFTDAFLKVDEVLYNATRGISNIISCHGYVNVDFADVVTIMKGMGDALMGIGISSGEHRAIRAAENALNSPLLDGVTIEGAQGVLVNITGGMDMTFMEIAEAVSLIEERAGGEANLIQGIVHDENMKDEIMVTVVATGFNKKKEEIKLEIKETVTELTELKDSMQTFKPKSIPWTSATIKAPKGPNQLGNYEIPSVLRDTKDEFDLGTIGNSYHEKIKNGLKYAPNSREVQSQPTFMRNLLD